VAPINYSDLVLVVHPSLQVSTLPDLIRLARTRPRMLNYASSGPGTPYHMAGELFRQHGPAARCGQGHEGSVEGGLPPDVSWVAHRSAPSH